MRELLPENLEKIARETGLIKRLRGFDDVESLVRLLMMHGSGLSLEQTALGGAELGRAQTTAVALHGRLKGSGAFFERLCSLMQEKLREHLGSSCWPEGWKFRAVDATEVREPGPTGSTWRVHYSLRLPDLICDHFLITDTSRGESLKYWKVAADEVILADRAYSHREAIAGLLEEGGHFVVRLNSGLFPLEDARGRVVNLPHQLRLLKIGKAKSWNLFFRSGEDRYPVRLCAVKKSPQACETARKKAQRRSQRDGVDIRTDTLLLADYVLVLTDLDPEIWDDQKVLELYRCRWQVELAFKRLKSLLHLGHLPKRDPSTAKAWIHLKLLLALIIEKLHFQSELFFPWGYELRAD